VDVYPTDYFDMMGAALDGWRGEVLVGSMGLNGTGRGYVSRFRIYWGKSDTTIYLSLGNGRPEADGTLLAG
jgi:hypothetical protein